MTGERVVIGAFPTYEKAVEAALDEAFTTAGYWSAFWQEVTEVCEGCEDAEGCHKYADRASSGGMEVGAFLNQATGLWEVTLDFEDLQWWIGCTACEEEPDGCE